jgi:hypothetical protein
VVFVGRRALLEFCEVGSIALLESSLCVEGVDSFLFLGFIGGWTRDLPKLKDAYSLFSLKEYLDSFFLLAQFML